MLYYKITPQEKEQIQGEEYAKNQYFYPIQDVNGDWFISEPEHQYCGLGEETEFVEPEPEILI